MKMVKSLLLGSAAGLVAVAGAQAADLPVKAKPVQYVKICSLYGVGFYYVPGTDMCIKVGGWARFEVGYGYNGSFTTEFYFNNVDNRSTNNNNWRVKGVATFDARSPTEYGTVRSYIALGVSNNNNGDNATTANYANRWFIQWAGFTIGHSASFFDFYSIGANQYGVVTFGSDSGDGGWDVFAYTAQFGSGFSGSISAEVQRRTYISYAGTGFGGGGSGLGTAGGLPFFGATLSTNYEGHDYPDVVANLRVDQPWGSAQIMGALHNVAATYYGNPATFVPTLETSGHPSDKLGFAAGVGIKLNADMIGKGDYFQIEGDYTQGASRYSSMSALTWNWSKYSRKHLRVRCGIRCRLWRQPGRWRTLRARADHDLERERRLYAQLDPGLEEHVVGRLPCSELQRQRQCHAVFGSRPWRRQWRSRRCQRRMRHGLGDVGRRLAYPVGGEQHLPDRSGSLVCQPQHCHHRNRHHRVAHQRVQAGRHLRTHRPGHLGGAPARQSGLLSLMA